MRSSVRFEEDENMPTELTSGAVINPNARTIPPIDISNVTRYSYGQYDDGSFAIWALGRASWFEIRPSRAYKEIYDDMLEAIEIFYFLKDTHLSLEEPCSARQLFAMYAQGQPMKARNAAVAAELVYEHREFVVRAMEMEDRENATDAESPLSWNTTPFYEHMKAKFPVLHLLSRLSLDVALTRCQELFTTTSKPKSRKPTPRATSISRNVERPATRSRKGSSHDGETSDSASVASSRRGTRKAGPPQSMPSAAEIESRAKSLCQFMQSVFDTGKLKARNMNVSKMASIMHERLDFDDDLTAHDYLHTYAANVVAIFESDMMRNTRWTELPIYTELKNSTLPVVVRKKMLLLNPSLRADSARRAIGDDVSEPSESTSSSADEIDFDRATSGLRLSGSKFASKGPARRVRKVYRHSLPATDGTNDDEPGTAMETDNVGPSKRKNDAVDTDVPPRKRKASRTQEVVFDESGSGSDEGDSEDELGAVALPLRRKETRPGIASNEAVRSGRAGSRDGGKSTRNRHPPPDPPSLPPVITRFLPSAEPNGPEGSWTCQVDGCAERIFGADKELGKRLVKEHIAEHEERVRSGANAMDDDGDDDHHVGGDGEALRLVRTEEEMCQLPVR